MPIDPTQPYDDNNIFARVLRGEIPSTPIYDDEFAYAFPDINPQAPTHILLVPTTHYANAAELAADDPHGLAALVVTARSVAEAEGIDRSGYRLIFNTGAGAGQTVFHAHLHLLGGRSMTWPPG